MPLQFGFKSNKQSAYDLQAPDPKIQVEDAARCDSNAVVYGISIATHEQFSYIPNMNTTKSLATDIIQLTRFKNRRPTIQDDRPQRKPSFRNIFLGVPDPGRRRFSEDIRGASLAAKTYAFKNTETKRVLLLQVFIPFLLSGFGNVSAGLFFNYAQTWNSFREDPIFYMLLATIMAFKTNMEATLAARLSTCSNMGTLKTLDSKIKAFLGNLSMVECQSILFSFMSSSLVVIVYAVTSGKFDQNLGLRVVATCMAAISVNEFISSILIFGVVILSAKAGVNPDNVSTLIAAMFGDFSAVVFLSYSVAFFHSFQTMQWLFIAIILGLASFLPLVIYYSSRNPFTKGTFIETHAPLALGVTLATVSGLVFDQAVEQFQRLVIYQVVFNGISVNLMAVQTSRISTYLQQLNIVAPTRAKEYANQCSPVRALYARDMNASVARWLVAMCVPAMTVYLVFIWMLAPASVDMTIYLFVCCFISIVTQIGFIQCLTYMVTPISWRFHWDPDNVVIPLLMAVSDACGNSILLMAFIYLRYVGDPNSISPHSSME